MGRGREEEEKLARKLPMILSISPLFLPPHYYLLLSSRLSQRTRAETLVTQAKQNSGPVNFVPKSRLQLVQISYIYQNNGREGLKPGSFTFTQTTRVEIFCTNIKP